MAIPGGSVLPEWWLSNSGLLAQTSPEYSQRAFSYGIFNADHFFDREQNALPDPFYFKPTDIILYDLIPKEELPKTKKGLIKLFRKCYSHKFLGGSSSKQDIDDLINGLDRTLHSGNSWHNTSLFDFAYDEELESYIYYFEICFHNFSSSYASVERIIGCQVQIDFHKLY